MTTTAHSEDSRAALMETLQEVEAGAMALRTAMLARNTDKIWGAVALQEDTLNHLSTALDHYESNVKDQRHEDGWAKDGLRTRLLAVADSVRSILRVNRVMAYTFVDLIDKTITQVATQVGRAPSVYNASGRMDPTTSPLIIQDRG